MVKAAQQYKRIQHHLPLTMVTMAKKKKNIKENILAGSPYQSSAPGAT